MKPEFRIKLCPENSLFRIDLKEGSGFWSWSPLQETILTPDGVLHKIIYFTTHSAASDYFNSLFGGKS